MKRIFCQPFLLFLQIPAETVQELRFCLQNAVIAMRSTDHPVTAIASGSELFLRFITLATLDTPVCLYKYLDIIISVFVLSIINTFLFNE